MVARLNDTVKPAVLSAVVAKARLTKISSNKPPPREECPICFLPMPLDATTEKPCQLCCEKKICALDVSVPLKHRMIMVHCPFLQNKSSSPRGSFHAIARACVSRTQSDDRCAQETMHLCKVAVLLQLPFLPATDRPTQCDLHAKKFVVG